MSERRLNVIDLMRQRHRDTHPWCSYGDKPHFIPPSMGDPGFYACEIDNPALAEPQEGESDG